MVNPRILWPIVLTAANNVLRAAYPSGGAATTCTVPAGTYYMSGDGTASDLVRAVADALDVGLPAGSNWSVSIGATGTITIGNPNDQFDLCFNDVPVPSTLHPVLGYASALYVAPPAQTVSAPYQHQFGWYPERSVRFSTGTGPERVVAVGEAISGRVALGQVASVTARNEQIDNLVPGKIRTNNPATGVPWAAPSFLNEDLETFWATLANLTDFRWYPDASVLSLIVGAPPVETAYSRMAIKDPAFLGRLIDKSIVGGPGGGAARLMYPTNELYSVTLPMQAYVV